MTTNDFVERVQEGLVSKLKPLGFEITQSEIADVFDNASVTLQGPGLQIRIVRERGEIFADFGPSSNVGLWYDSAVVMDYLGLSAEAGFHDRNLDAVLRGVASFVTTCGFELSRKFDEAHLATTRKELEDLKQRRAEDLFGG